MSSFRRISHSVDSSKTPKITNNSSANRNRVRTLSNGNPKGVKSSRKKKSKNSKSNFKTWISSSRSSSNSGYTSTSLSGLSTLSSCKKFGLETIMKKIFKSRIYVCADQCYAFDGPQGVCVTYKFIIASESSPFFPASNFVLKSPLAVYESAVTSHVVRDEQSKNTSFGCSKIALQIFDGHVVYKRDIQIPFCSSSNNVMQGIPNNKVRIDYMFRKFTNNSYGSDNEILQWPEEISTYVVNTDIKCSGSEVQLRDVMEVWFGLDRFTQEMDDYNVATVNYREQETIHRSFFEMKTGETCARISRKLAFPTSVIGDTFEVAYTKEFFMNYINGKWIKESENKCPNKGNLHLLNEISSFGIDGNSTMRDMSFDVKEVPRYNSKLSSVQSDKDSQKIPYNANTSTNIPDTTKSFKDSPIPISHSTPRISNIFSTNATHAKSNFDNQTPVIQKNTTPSLLTNFTPHNTTLNKTNDSTPNIYYSILSNATVMNRAHNTPVRPFNKEANLSVKKTIDKILGDAAKQSENSVNMVENSSKTYTDTTLCHSDTNIISKVALDKPKLPSDNNLKSPIVFRSEPVKESPLKALLDKLDTTQDSDTSQSSIKAEVESNAETFKNSPLLLSNNITNSSGRSCLADGKSLSTIKEMSLEQGQSHSTPSKSTMSIFSSKTNNTSLNLMSSIKEQTNEVAVPKLEEMECTNSYSSTSSLTKDLEEDVTQNESKLSISSNVLSPGNKILPCSNQKSQDSIIVQPLFGTPLNAGISLNDTQNSCTSIGINTPIGSQSVPRKGIFVKSIVRDKPDIKRPSAPSSQNRINYTPDNCKKNKSQTPVTGKKGYQNINFSYLQTSRTLQPPMPLNRTTSAFGLRGDDSHSSLVNINKSVDETPKKKLYRTLSETPTKRRRSTSNGILSESSIENRGTLENEIKYLDNEKSYLRNESQSPSRRQLTKSSPRTFRNKNVKMTPSSKFDKNNDETMVYFDKKTDETLDIGSRELIECLNKMSVKESDPTKSVKGYINHGICETFVNIEGNNNNNCLSIGESKSLEINTLVGIGDETQELKLVYNFDNVDPSTDIKSLSLIVDGKVFYKRIKLYNI
uniref:SET domain-containing protein n=1 Tax=Strongyloides venezuelensis TaxID=75913 RepID=A0A0K0FNI8_STRVS